MEIYNLEMIGSHPIYIGGYYIVKLAFQKQDLSIFGIGTIGHPICKRNEFRSSLHMLHQNKFSLRQGLNEIMKALKDQEKNKDIESLATLAQRLCSEQSQLVGC